MNLLTKLYKYLLGKRDWELIAILLAVSIAFDLFAYYIMQINFSEGDVESLGFQERCFALLLFAPIAETLFFQFLCFEGTMLCCSCIKYRDRVFLSYVISTSLFIVSHGMLLSDLIGVLIIGMSLGIIYVVQRSKRGIMHACISTFILHLIYNALSMIINANVIS